MSKTFLAGDVVGKEDSPPLMVACACTELLGQCGFYRLDRDSVEVALNSNLLGQNKNRITLLRFSDTQYPVISTVGSK